MAKSKKDIEKFQEALSLNTEFLNEDILEDEILFGSDKSAATPFSIDKSIYKQFKILAIYQKRDIHEIIKEALNHYLNVKKFYLNEAMKELTKDDK